MGASTPRHGCSGSQTHTATYSTHIFLIQRAQELCAARSNDQNACIGASRHANFAPGRAATAKMELLAVICDKTIAAWILARGDPQSKHEPCEAKLPLHHATHIHHQQPAAPLAPLAALCKPRTTGSNSQNLINPISNLQQALSHPPLFFMVFGPLMTPLTFYNSLPSSECFLPTYMSQNISPLTFVCLYLLLTV